MSRNNALTLFAHHDVSSYIYDHGSTANMVKTSRLSTLTHYGLQDRIRGRLAKYLSRWFPANSVMNEMRETSLSIFDQSSYAFLYCEPHILHHLHTLYVICKPSEKSRILAFFLQNGYQQYSASLAKKETQHLSLNKFISAPEVFKNGCLRIALVSTVNNSIIQAALGTVTTAFMNVIGPDSFWSAHRTGPAGSQSYQNPSYNTGACPKNFPMKIKYAHKICDDCQVQNHLLIWRTMVERPHKNECSTHPDCPQTLRTSNDNHCPCMYFGRDYKSASGQQVREQFRRHTDSVTWRLGGSCYRHTVAMTPICVPISHLDKPLYEPCTED